MTDSPCPTCGGRDVEPMPEGADVLQRPEDWCGEYWIRESEYDALVAERQRLKEELKVTDHLLDERELVLRAIPECPAHGACVPHALEWIEKTKGAEAALAQLQAAVREKAEAFTICGNQKRELANLNAAMGAMRRRAEAAESDMVVAERRAEALATAIREWAEARKVYIEAQFGKGAPLEAARAVDDAECRLRALVEGEQD
jgi:hypothetical protein